MVSEKNATQKDFSAILFKDLFSDNKKIGVIRKEVYELSSCGVINDGKGDFNQQKSLVKPNNHLFFQLF